MATTNFTLGSDRSYIKNELSEMLKAICQEKGLNFVISKTIYSVDSLKITLELGVAKDGAESGVVNPYLPYEKAWNDQWSRYSGLGLKREWLGKKFQYGSTQYTIVGLSTRKSKWPVMCANRFGDLRKFSVSNLSMKTFID